MGIIEIAKALERPVPSPLKGSSITKSDIGLVKDIDFTEGFSQSSFKTDLGILASTEASVGPNSASSYEASFITSIPSGKEPGRMMLYSWRVRINVQESAYWIGLERDLDHSASWDRPMPVIYRMALYKNGGDVCAEWGDFHVFRSEFGPSGWHAIRKSTEGLETMIGISLIVLISVPISFTINNCSTDGEASVTKAKYSPIDRSDENTMQMQAFIFEKVVLGQGLKEDEENDQKDQEDDNDENSDPILEAYVSDVILVLVNDGKKSERVFPCHRPILVMGSSYFHKQFRQRRMSSRSNRSAVMEDGGALGTIEIDGIDKETMIVVLQYIYTDCPPEFRFDESGKVEQGRIVKIAAAAAKLDLLVLKYYCLSKLMFCYTDDGYRMEQLPWADKLKVEDLKAVCVEQLSMFLRCGGDIDSSLMPYFKPFFRTIIVKSLVQECQPVEALKLECA